MAEILSQNDKRSALEREVSELRSKLLIAENEIVRRRSFAQTSSNISFILPESDRDIRESGKDSRTGGAASERGDQLDQQGEGRAAGHCLLTASEDARGRQL